MSWNGILYFLNVTYFQVNGIFDQKNGMYGTWFYPLGIDWEFQMDAEAWREEVECQDGLVTLAKKDNSVSEIILFFSNMISLE